MVNVFGELGDNLAAELVLGDPPREVSDDRLGVVNVRVSNLKQEVAISSKDGAPKFDPGVALSQQFGTPRQCGGGKPCSGVILKLVQYKKNLIKEDPNKQNQDVEIYSSQVWIFLFLCLPACINVCNKREWNNCFTKNNQEILIDLADFALREPPEDKFNGRCFAGMV